MNREIKFRAWIGKLNQMSDEVTVKYDGTFSAVIGGINGYSTADGGVLMQYTGLTDKNGVEIYEGDIVKIGKELIEEIKWVDESNWNDTKCSVNGWVNHESIYTEKPEVIGNIYQNPELLN
jgi:uncharacterized phage protein (TIGR01671 family)